MVVKPSKIYFFSFVIINYYDKCTGVVGSAVDILKRRTDVNPREKPNPWKNNLPARSAFTETVNRFSP